MAGRNPEATVFFAANRGSNPLPATIQIKGVSVKTLSPFSIASFSSSVDLKKIQNAKDCLREAYPF
jgi:hypothetical protein